jgi:hypothetical protein
MRHRAAAAGPAASATAAGQGIGGAKADGGDGADGSVDGRPEERRPANGSPAGRRPVDRVVGSESLADSATAHTVAATAGATVESMAGGTEAVPGLGHARLRLSFSADSWVEAHDATGRLLFAGRGRANSVKTIAGAAPVRVYLGFASGVQLEVNSRVVAIGPQFVSGEVARFEAGADGVLRRDAHATAADTAHPRG